MAERKRAANLAADYPASFLWSGCTHLDCLPACWHGLEDGHCARLAKEWEHWREDEMTLFWHPTGPRVTYRDGLFKVQDLNPEVEARWIMSRGEMIRLGWRCIVAALRR